MALIELQGLSKIYDRGKPNEFKALHNVSITVEQGEFVAIMGVSGSGKSTLMNIIGCLDTPTSGEYLLHGDKVSLKSPQELVRIRRSKVGFVFQNFNLLPRLSSIANVELPLIYAGVSTRERRERARLVLKQVGLGDKLNHKPSMLSGGELQRVAIARALVNQPTLILADEPTGNLDTKSGNQIMQVLADFNKQGTTIIVVTHDYKIAERAQRILKIEDGEIIP